MWIFFFLQYHLDLIRKNKHGSQEKSCLNQQHYYQATNNWDPWTFQTGRHGNNSMHAVHFWYNDFDSVKLTQTINDVLFGVISSGLSRYLDHRSPEGKARFCFGAWISDFEQTFPYYLYWIQCLCSSERGPANNRNGHG